MNFINRRKFLAEVGAGAAGIGFWQSLSAAELQKETGTRRVPMASSLLAEPQFRPLPLGSIQPAGWLDRQLRIQANGLTGYLDEFWPDVAKSQWFGGTAEGWERAPYWMDGLIALAWVLNDAFLKEKSRRHVEQIVRGQRPDGWYAPYPITQDKRYDLWSILLINKVLAQYHEATGDADVLNAILRNLKACDATLDRTPLFDWGKFRWFEGLIPVFYCYEISGERWLLDLARKLHEQGFDYMKLYGGNEITQPTARRGKWTWEKHVVNAAMAIKAYGLSWRLTQSETERSFPTRMLQVLDRFHGQATGIFSGDECLSGSNPLQGTELCAVVEALFSLEKLVSITGEPAYADRLERIAFNALPAAFKPDMWAHQYDQQVNQVQCTINPEHGWSTNNEEANLYGLEPHYGCCTANMHQGWPKFAAHLWMKAAGDGIAAVAYAPSTARITIKGVPVQLSISTDYPFRDTLRVNVKTEKAVQFPLSLRIPGWTKGASCQWRDTQENSLEPNSFHTIAREWSGSTDIELRFPMSIKATERFNHAVAIERGPLVYSLRLEESWTRVNANKAQRELPHGDFEVRPTSPWNFGLLLREGELEQSIEFSEQPVGVQPFSPQGAGVVAKVKGRQIPEWKIEKGWAGETPTSPVQSEQPLEELTLIPYGCTNIRITEFPKLKG